eukprot:179981-Ditylum_brightwellii.AAC.1
MKKKKKQNSLSLLKTDYDVALNWKLGQEMNHTLFFRESFKVAHHQDIGAFEPLLETDDSYKTTRAKHIDHQLNMTKSALASQQKLANVLQILEKEKPTTRHNINGLKMLGLIEPRIKKKISKSSKQKQDDDNEVIDHGSNNSSDNNDKEENISKYETVVTVA